VLPAGGDYGEGVTAQYVVVTDGAPWLVDRVAGELVGALVVLDAWHAMEYLADHAAALYDKGKRAAKRLYKRMVEALFGRKPSRRVADDTRPGVDTASAAAPCPALASLLDLRSPRVQTSCSICCATSIRPPSAPMLTPTSSGRSPGTPTGGWTTRRCASAA